MLGQVGLLRGLADRDILRAAGDGQHRAARARQLRKYRGPVSQRRGGGPRAAGGRQGGRADSPVRVGASAPPGESGARAAGGDEAVELQRGRSGLHERGAGGAGGRPGGAAPAGGGGGEQEPKPAGRNRSRPLPPAAAAGGRRGAARASAGPRQHDDWARRRAGRAGGAVGGGRGGPRRRHLGSTLPLLCSREMPHGGSLRLLRGEALAPRAPEDPAATCPSCTGVSVTGGLSVCATARPAGASELARTGNMYGGKD